MHQRLKNQSKDVLFMLEQGFINLKYKAARCAKRCFETQAFSEALPCEKKCLNSIKRVSEALNMQKELIDKKLESCIQEVESGRQGTGSKLALAFEGPSACYEIYIEDLQQLKQEMITEFNYYI